MMLVQITDEAEGDLAQIGEHIATNSPTRAITFLQELLTACRKLAHTPFGSALLDGFEADGIRRRPYGNYVILYRVRGNAIEVLNVLHGARNYRAMLRGSP